MKQIFILLIFFPIIIFAQENNIDKSVLNKYKSIDLSTIQTIKELTKNISQLTTNKKEQLQMLLLWTHDNMYADSIRFFNNGYSLSTAQSLKKRIALCDEFSNIFNDFCKTNKITSIRVVGYVKYLNFIPRDNFYEANHAWNAVYIDSTWMICDLFWATNILSSNENSSPHFVKKLNTKYFLSPPANFIITHLPCDPIFQFDNYPITINAFTNLSNQIDSTIKRMNYCNYNDSIKQVIKLNNNERTLLIAKHSYEYNKYNPNILIVEYYNYGVLIVNNKTSTTMELKKAKIYFSSAIMLIDRSKDKNIIALKESCKQGLSSINRRINAP